MTGAQDEKRRKNTKGQQRLEAAELPHVVGRSDDPGLLTPDEKSTAAKVVNRGWSCLEMKIWGQGGSNVPVKG